MSIGNIIRGKRFDLSLSQHDVAKAVGVSEATVSRWETGEITSIRSNRIIALAKVLEIPPATLLENGNTQYGG